jgi:hypothetical protein
LATGWDGALGGIKADPTADGSGHDDDDKRR